ncbi:MAG: hypothetical protein QOE87_977, partial [Gaiellales bacterium]|nr:hypothetical protein [Gaiellales bacterium]
MAGTKQRRCRSWKRATGLGAPFQSRPGTSAGTVYDSPMGHPQLVELGAQLKM